MGDVETRKNNNLFLEKLVIRILSFLIRVLAKIVYSLQSVNNVKEDLNSNHFQGAAQKTSGKLSRAILITTFEKRQFTSAIPLVESIRNAGIDLPIAVFVNGNLNGNHDVEKRANLLVNLGSIPNVSVICSNVMTGISRNWNLGIQLLGADYVLCLSDDLEIGTGVKRDFDSAFSIAEKEDLVLMGSFASFIISARCIEKVGWFDERFLGFGEEDGDYVYRFIEEYKREPKNYYTSAVRHLNLQSRGDEVSNAGKYSLFNFAFRNIKYKKSSTGIVGMFDHPLTKIIDDYNLHPMENFRRKNAHLLKITNLDQIRKEIEI
jgi:hypothetical protein